MPDVDAPAQAGRNTKVGRLDVEIHSATMDGGHDNIGVILARFSRICASIIGLRAADARAEVGTFVGTLCVCRHFVRC